MTARLAIVVVAALGAAACHRAPSSEASSRPRLTAIVPESLTIERGGVAELELRGRGFDTQQSNPANAVFVGGVRLVGVKANANGTTLRIALPEGVPVPGNGAPPQPWTSGRHAVFVVNANGTSDTLYLVVRATGGPRP